MVPEATLEKTEAGFTPVGGGWFVLNAREARWRHRPGRGDSLPFTGWTDSDCETYFPQVGITLVVLGPGEPIGMYHWEADQEDFLVLFGEALLIVEGQERPLRQWDFVHCPPETRHMIFGAGDGPCAVLAIGAREHIDTNCNGGAYTVDEAALRHGGGVEQETSDAELAYARFPTSEPTRYRDGWLPGVEGSFSQESVAAVVQVIAARRSIRSFGEEMPAREALDQVIAAGLAAPYAAAMAPGAALERRFLVLPRGSAALTAAAAAIRAHATAALTTAEVPLPLRARLEPIAQGRILGVGTAPYYVVVAERGTTLPVQQQSLAHVLENMWLMVTALGLGMHLVSVTTMMADDSAFCRVLGLPAGEYALTGCAIGVPGRAPDARSLSDVGGVTTWLD